MGAIFRPSSPGNCHEYTGSTATAALLRCTGAISFQFIDIPHTGKSSKLNVKRTGCVTLGQFAFNSMIIPKSRPCKRLTQLLLFIYDGAVEVPSQLCTHVEVNTERCSAFSRACGHQSIDCMFPYGIGSVGCQGNVLDMGMGTTTKQSGFATGLPSYGILDIAYG